MAVLSVIPLVETQPEHGLPVLMDWEHLPKEVLVVKAAMFLEVITSQVGPKMILTSFMNLPIWTTPLVDCKLGMKFRRPTRKGMM